ncbi:MAG: response regulator [Gemmatimonadota bacterium]
MTPESAFHERGGQATVLVLDDDPAFRASVEGVLKRAGYRVRTAVDAREALALLEDLDPDRVIVLCDLVLPGLDGREAANVILAHHPRVRIVYTSGYTQHESFVADLIADGEIFLEKPFEVAALTYLLRSLLPPEGTRT